jgi:hypothetical protein
LFNIIISKALALTLKFNKEIKMKVKNVFWHILFLGVVGGVFFSITLSLFDKSFRLESSYVVPAITVLAIFAIFVYFLYEYVNKIVGRPKELIYGKTYHIINWFYKEGVGCYLIAKEFDKNPRVYYTNNIILCSANEAIELAQAKLSLPFSLWIYSKDKKGDILASMPSLK